ncbi:MAG: ribonuclease HII [Kineosporiaceae bacterium]
MSAPPTLREERRLLRSGHHLVAGMDEVGRGALAGPVSVGIVVVDLDTRTAPAGVRDSKLLTPAARESLVPALARWGVARAVGHAGPDEIDACGILGALRLAANRALQALAVMPACLLLDGSHDWFTPPRPAEPDLLDLLDAVGPEPSPPPTGPTVVTKVKADRSCAAVAAASVLAKVERDRMMVELARAHPGYGWEANKGYSAPDHVEALSRLGPCVQHRRSWSLPGVVAAGRVPSPSAEVVSLPEPLVELEGTR